MRKINELGLGLLKEFEGLRLYPYRDSARLPTIGYGATFYLDNLPVTMSSPPISKEEADTLLRRDIGWAERGVIKYISSPLTDNEFAALTSFTYNLGRGALQRSTLRSMLNRGDYMGAANEFPKWRRAGGKIIRGLVIRRARERKLFLS